MTAMTSTAQPSATTPRWPVLTHYAGGVFLGLIGVGHLLALHIFNGADVAGEEVINELSRNTTTALFEGGREVTVFGLNTGYSVALGLFGMLFPLLAATAVRAAPGLLTRWSLFGAICAAVAGGTFWISCLYFPETVVAFAGLSALCYAAVLVGGPRKSVN
ncbi:LIC_13387 family protein [Nocardia bhagyanarayanae]|uniref:Uncharacterized protein n=1 Tax=Nocardia bhagyanarayanae TaxID=1215925 RepID=A0A543F3V0_9NOCA|nr:hypothetical protein [Nocardia bhagyanarayanae]TQM28502.1 hypothetical protein FB390_0071 [Nocardia bhagyanarayanae]